jgi:glucose/arabinose dehydrogenase
VLQKGGGALASANRIMLLRDANGVAETRSVLIAGLKVPLAMALAIVTLYLADTDAVLSVPYRIGAPPPDYALGPYRASLGLVFARDARLCAASPPGAFVGRLGRGTASRQADTR